MLTGMGLALGIDYSLFVVSRYREERARGLAKDEAIARTGATASRAVLFSGSDVRRRAARDVPRPDLDHAQPRARRDPRRHRLGRRGADAAAGAAQHARRPRQLAPGPVLRPQPRPRRRGAKGGFWQPDRERRRCDGPRSRSRCLGRRDCSRSRSPSSACTSARTASPLCPTSLPSKQGYLAAAARVPGPEPGAGARSSPSAGRRGVRDAASRLDAQARGRPQLRPGAIQHAVAGRRPARSTAHGARPRRPGRRSGGRRRARSACATSSRRSFAGTRRAGLRRRHDGGERRLLRRGDEPDALRAPLRARAQLHPAHGRVPLARRRARLDRCSTCSRSAPPTGCSRSSSSTATARACSASSTRTSIDAWVPLFLFSVLFGLSMDYQVFLMSRIKERYDATRLDARRGASAASRPPRGSSPARR